MVDWKFGIPEFIVLMIALVFLALFIFAWAKVFEKAGYAPLLCLLMLIPGVSLIMFFWFAFSKWPIHRQQPSGPPSGV
jgi:uncharacterized protein YybS (DUF2232 family)